MAKKKKYKEAASFIVSLALILIVINKIQPSMFPKGYVVKMDNPGFEHKDIKAKDVMLKPLNPDDRDKRYKENLEAGLHFK